MSTATAVLVAARSGVAAFAVTTPFESGVDAEVARGRAILGVPRRDHGTVDWTRFGTWADRTFSGDSD